jgi:hypothetical protein
MQDWKDRGESLRIVTLNHKHTNAFMLEGDGWLMIDAGYPEWFPALKRAEEEIKRQTKANGLGNEGDNHVL